MKLFLEKIKGSPWISILLRWLWYLFLIFLLFLFGDAPERGFRYWGL